MFTNQATAKYSPRPSVPMRLSKKDNIHIRRATIESKKSTMLMKHGCVVAEGRKVLTTGHNHMRTQYKVRFSNVPSCSCHAEIDALRKLIRLKTKGKSSTSSTSSKFRKKVVQPLFKVAN